MRTKNQEFWDFQKAKEFVHSLKIDSYDAWLRYRKSNRRPLSIPSDPYRAYKHIWISWGDWLGTNNIHGSIRKYTVNDDFFKVWTSDMAYILGFWWADGFITSKQFSITQHKNDKYILEDFLKKMDSNYPVNFHYRNNFRFFLKSEEIVRDIKNLGGTEQKSLRNSFPINIPNKYICDFVRGYFDGDGSVCIDNKTKGLVISFSSGSKTFTKKLAKVICVCLPKIKAHIYSKTVKKGTKVCNGILKEDSTNYRLVFFKNDSKSLYEFMFQNDSNMCLGRKKNKLEEMFGPVKCSQNTIGSVQPHRP